MTKASWIVPPVIGLFLSAAAYADDEKPSDTAAPEPVSAAVFDVPSLLDSKYTYRPSPTDPIVSFPEHVPRPFANLYFRDGSVLGRVSGVRSLSLLTLAETGQTRLFLGVNETGLLGLHFNAFQHHSGERYLEVVRMPYLEKTEPVDEGEHPSSTD